ncbi:hypothetical protein PLICRDRAFT_180312 [Plicaturopsis crispa FD-325 SS-3]|uniref:Uncharacterized protein n=1 Tax=Plicaturopsis crispa FD-325 SS-3 TaxID=944288 RepID=A0A0C9T2N7_PLICR|nr:hypothetical protein PLICRDRAFT_180312 [Plicaturopsis crispa FD-325 SS-3]
MSPIDYVANKLPLAHAKPMQTREVGSGPSVEAISEALENPDGDVVKSHGGSGRYPKLGGA